MKTVVTGATGRVGANLIKRLCTLGYDVIGCILPDDPHEAKLDSLPIEKAHLNIMDAAAVMEIIKDAEIVIHTAAVHEGSLSKLPNTDFFDINVKGMFNVLEAIRHSGKRTQLICLSSSAVYDVFTAPTAPIKEMDRRRPITLYGLTKILVEEQTRQYEWEYDIPATIIRPNYIITGPEMLGAFNLNVVFDVLYKYADNANVQFHYPEQPDAWMTAKSDTGMSGETLCVPRCPDGQSWQWHMTDIRDVIDFIELCMNNEKAWGQTFNIAGADVGDWSEVVPYIAEKTGRKIVSVDIPNSWRYCFDQSAAKDVLGFTSQYDHQAMVDIAMAMQQNEDVGIIRSESFMLA